MDYESYPPECLDCSRVESDGPDSRQRNQLALGREPADEGGSRVTRDHFAALERIKMSQGCGAIAILGNWIVMKVI